jgi:hypothetical protein
MSQQQCDVASTARKHFSSASPQAIKSVWSKYRKALFLLAVIFPTTVLAIPETLPDPDIPTYVIIGRRNTAPWSGVGNDGVVHSAPIGFSNAVLNGVLDFYDDLNSLARNQEALNKRRMTSDVRCLPGLAPRYRNVTSQSSNQLKYEVAVAAQEIVRARFPATLLEWTGIYIFDAFDGGYGDFKYGFRLIYADGGWDWWHLNIPKFDSPPNGTVIPNSNFGFLPGGGTPIPNPNCP